MKIVGILLLALLAYTNARWGTCVSNGDPHYRLFNGRALNNQYRGTLQVARTNKFTVHALTAKWSRASVNNAVAVLVNGKHRVVIQDTYARYITVNGKRVNLRNGNRHFSGFYVTKSGRNLWIRSGSEFVFVQVNYNRGWRRMNPRGVYINLSITGHWHRYGICGGMGVRTAKGIFNYVRPRKLIIKTGHCTKQQHHHAVVHCRRRYHGRTHLRGYKNCVYDVCLGFKARWSADWTKQMIYWKRLVSQYERLRSKNKAQANKYLKWASAHTNRLKAHLKRLRHHRYHYRRAHKNYHKNNKNAAAHRRAMKHHRRQRAISLRRRSSYLRWRNVYNKRANYYARLAAAARRKIAKCRRNIRTWNKLNKRRGYLVRMLRKRAARNLRLYRTASKRSALHLRYIRHHSKWASHYQRKRNAALRSLRHHQRWTKHHLKWYRHHSKWARHYRNLQKRYQRAANRYRNHRNNARRHYRSATRNRNAQHRNQVRVRKVIGLRRRPSFRARCYNKVVNLRGQKDFGCPNGYAIKYFYRRTGRDTTVYDINHVQCCKVRGDNHQRTANWWRSFDRKGWSTCPTGYVMKGIWKTNGPWLYNFELARCTRAKYGRHCYTENVWSKFDHRGWTGCRRGGYVVSGLWRNTCHNVYCIELLRCCRGW